MTEQEQRNVETAKRYLEFYNDDIDRFVSECYTPDCIVYAMGVIKLEGAEEFLAAEKVVLAAAPRRYMRLENMHASGEVVINEVTLL